MIGLTQLTKTPCLAAVWGFGFIIEKVGLDHRGRDGFFFAWRGGGGAPRKHRVGVCGAIEFARVEVFIKGSRAVVCGGG